MDRIRARAAVPGPTVLFFNESVAGVLGCATGERVERGTDLRTGDRRVAGRTARPIRGALRDHADALGTHPIAQPLDQRRNCAVRGAAPASRVGRLIPFPGRASIGAPYDEVASGG